MSNNSWLNLPISWVSSAKVTKTFPTTCGEAVEGIRSGKWEGPVGRVRERYRDAFAKAVQDGNPDPALAAKNAVRSLKRNLPAITFHGTFSERADDQLITYSGVFCADLDGCPNGAKLKTQLERDEYIQMVCESPTGSGLKALLRVVPDPAMHLRSFFAVEKYFKDVHGVEIDPACKNLSRLCYVAHDPNAFIRIEDAKILEPLPEEKPSGAAPKEATREATQGDLNHFLLLPKDGFTSYTASARTLFERIIKQEPPQMFIRGGRIVTIKETTADSGATQLDIQDASPHAFGVEVEKYGTIFRWGVDQNGKAIMRPNTLMSQSDAQFIMAASEREMLPPLAMVHHCPLLIERGGKPIVLEQGYHRDMGGRYITSNAVIQKMTLAEAINGLLELIEEVPFATDADKARAVAAIITPAFRFGGLLPRCHFPIILVEADQPQAGKGTLIEAIQRFYGEVCELTGKRKGGVGSFDEDLSRQMLRGRPFIPIDNVREALDSQFFELSLTCPFGGTVSARVPHKGGVSVNPNRHIFHLTSNKFESTQDLAVRSCIIRLQKRHGHQWKKFDDGRELLAHLEANFQTSISIIYTIAKRWIAEGKPQNVDELRGEGRFRDWWQVADWIAQKVFRLPPPLDGHEKIQKRVASAAQSWARAMGNLLKVEEMLDVELTATELVELANGAGEDAQVEIPGLPPKADDKDKVKRVGSVMAQLFKGTPAEKEIVDEIEIDVHRIEIDAYLITRVERVEQRSDHYDSYTRKTYVFQQIEGQ